MKKTLLVATAALCGLGMSAQFSADKVWPADYHGFAIDATQQLIDKTYQQPLEKPYFRTGRIVELGCIYQPEYVILEPNAELTEVVTPGSTLDTDNATDLAMVIGANKNSFDKTMPAGKIDGNWMTPVMDENGLAYVTIPDQYYKGGELVDVPATGGDIRVRFFFPNPSSGEYKGKCRINDAPEMRADDLTGVYVTIDAPATVKIANDFVQASTNAFTSPYEGSTGDALGTCQRVARLDLPSTDGNGPQDLTAGTNFTHCWNLMTYVRDKSGTKQDTYGFPINTVDLVFMGVKPGERVGWTNYQTLHEGYTPFKYATAGIETVAAEADAPVEYYNLQGMKVANPANGIYIERKGTAVRKIAIR